MKKVFTKLTLIALSVLTVGCSTHDGDMRGYAYEPSIDGLPVNITAGDQFGKFEDNPFIEVTEKPVSTFSVDADGASYGVMRRYINDNIAVDPASVRIEEFLNYFTFDYAAPKDDNTVAINTELAACPWNQEHLLLRLGIKGKDIEPSKMPRANFVFLVDVSGSMDSNDRLDLLKSGLKELLSKMNPDDRISLITY